MHPAFGHEHAFDGVHVGDHRVQRERFVRGEPGVHRLEAEDALQAIVVEERRHLGAELAESAELDEFEAGLPRLDQVEWRVEVRVDERIHLRPVQLLEPDTEATERLGVLVARELPDLLGHRLAAVAHEERGSVGIHRPVHRVDRVDRDVVLHLGTRSVERGLEEVRHREHRRPVVESETALGDHSGSAAGNRVTFDDGDVMAGTDEVGSGREPSQTCTNNNNLHQTLLQLT